MSDHIYDREIDGDPFMSASHILSLARVGVAASESIMNVNLQRDGYQNLLEVIGDIAGRLTEEILELQRQNEILSKASQTSQERG
ncbi:MULTISPECIES: hypothetical protein [unclassified Roseovarius]|uniref:hypothetical protein n=1 Tax=unclassified Roseovarius TaxID=2614913 RepID=UPI00273FD7F9|nr:MULTISPECIES: hypothetical protein [unclassified Roseovarius]